VGWRNIVWATANGARAASVMVNVDTTHVSWAKLRAAAKARSAAVYPVRGVDTRFRLPYHRPVGVAGSAARRRTGQRLGGMKTVTIRRLVSVVPATR